MGSSEDRASGRPKKVAGGERRVPGSEISESSSYDWLERSLKQLFDDVAGEPIPQRIMDKLKDLGRKIE